MNKTLMFALERWIQRGVAYQLMLMAALIVLVAIAGGVAAWLATDKFAHVFEACWWAFLRLTDPGYLGDDEGIGLRIISTIVTVLGYVLFMGSLIAIMTQWLAMKIRTLERGLTPIRMRDHVVILGWTNRTPEIIATIVRGKGRLQRFLDDHKVRRLRIVVLDDDVDPQRQLQIRDSLGKELRHSQVFLRSGSALRTEPLQRLDITRAAAVVVPGSDFELGGAELTDARVVKILLTMRGLFAGVASERRPQVVAEIFNSDSALLAEKAIGDKIEVVTTDRVISRLVSQSIRHRGLAGILFGLLTHRQGDSIYLRRYPELAGRTARQLSVMFAEAVVLGIVRVDAGGLRAVLDPRSSEALQPNDQLVLLAETYAQCVPRKGVVEKPATTIVSQPLAPRARVEHRVLVLGWSHKVARLIGELDESDSGRFEVTIMSKVPVSQREAALAGMDYSDDRIQIRHALGDYASERELGKVDPMAFDHVLFVASGWMGSSEEADARTVLGFVLLRSMLEGKADAPEVLVELLEPSNAHLFGDAKAGLVLVSPRILSQVLGHVALRPELNVVFDALFCSGGTEFDLRSPEEFGLAGRPVGFAEIQAAAFERGAIALGVATVSGANREVDLNPARTRRWTLTSADELVVLTAVEP